MSQIKAKDTKPELVVRRFLHSKGFRYRLHVKDLPGKPDLVLSKPRTIIQIHGCFWHGHQGCKYYKTPKTRTEWWSDKIKKTIRKDLENKEILESQGWKVIIIWECQLKNNRAKTLENLEQRLMS